MFDARSSHLKRRLLAVVAVALLPVVLLAVIGVTLLARQDYDEARRASIERVRAISSAVDAELARSIAGLTVLSQSSSLREENFARFYELCARVREQQPAWATITLARPDGSYIFNLREPFGAQLPKQEKDYPVLARAIATRRPVIGNMFTGQLARESIFTIRVPVVIGDSPRYVLSVALKPSSMLDVIRRQEVPADSVITVLDGNQTIVARTRSHEEFAGKLASQSLRDIMARGREGWGLGQTLEGQYTYSAVSRSGWSGWAVAFGQPRDAVDAPLHRSLAILATGITLSIALGILAALFLGRRITQPMKALQAAAHSMGAGELPKFPHSDIVEIEDVSRALAQSAERLERSRIEREELVTRAEDARRVAEQSNKAKDEFLAMLGHELRNPLAAISNAAQLLDRARGDEKIATRAQQVIARQTSHLSHMMDDLLDAARVTSGKIVLDRVRCDLAEVTGRALETLRTAGQLADRHVVADLAPAWIDADVSRIEQIVTNLVGNALKYSGPDARIAVSVAREGAFAVLRVTDSGIGIEPELLPKVFDLFVQGERTLERAQGGLGIGLTLVRRLVELHGGSVSADSAGAGAGSVFTARFAAEEGPSREANAAQPARGSRRKVLIVEDNDDAREMMRTLLEEVHGHEVCEAVDGPGGVRAAIEQRPQFAFIDLGLPGFDGYEVARRIRESVGPNSVRLIALTGYGAPEDQRRTAQAGFDLHLVKPVEHHELERVFNAS